ncbi:unnamed protein product [Gongylonema pulchrum]|uniref:Uncharacterized protein n=1 Tax=Gongylonema pulchrum TaxID=637853 RepID=A0A3P7P470_9BILA|nr:unnamed protein product [Gongylonema pulchrum]
MLAFAFAFHLVMRNSGQEPWEATEVVSIYYIFVEIFPNEY